MLIVFLYFTAFIVVNLISRVFINPGARKLFQLVSCFILLFAFFGLRDITILNDTPHYYGYYYAKSQYTSYINGSIFDYKLADKFEWGFQVLVHFLIKYVSKDPYTIILFSSLLVTIGDLWFICKKSENVAMVCFFMLTSYIFFMHYCIIRQSIAILIFYIAYCKYLEKDKNIKYCILILFASLFHISAIVLLLLPLFKKMKINKRNVIITLSVFAFVAIFIFQILSILGLHNNPYYKMAIQRETMSIVGLIECLLITLVLSVCYYIHKKDNSIKTDKNAFWVCVFAMGIGITLPVFFVFERINDYLWPIMLIEFLKHVAPQYIYGESTNKLTGHHLLKKCFEIFIAFIFIIKIIGINTYRPEWLHIVPYKMYDFSAHYHYYHLYPQE
jgi:hypothetical protein